MEIVRRLAVEAAIGGVQMESQPISMNIIIIIIIIINEQHWREI